MGQQTTSRTNLTKSKPTISPQRKTRRFTLKKVEYKEIHQGVTLLLAFLPYRSTRFDPIRLDSLVDIVLNCRSRSRHYNWFDEILNDRNMFVRGIVRFIVIYIVKDCGPNH